jgi:pilus assembly protein CpaD
MLFRPGGAAVLALAGLALSGCAGYPAHSVTVGALPQDYRTNHPIIVSEQEQTLDVPVAAGDSKLAPGIRETVRGFADRYRQTASGTVRILVPAGSANAAAASIAARQIHAVLVHRGIPGRRIITVPYAAGAGYGDAPVRISYFATAAHTTPCGTWPEDLVTDTSQNRNYDNFGCATQNNLAAQVANPMDLIAPRGMTPIDAERRTQVYRDYVANGSVAGTED